MDSQPPNNDDVKPAKRSFLDRFRGSTKGVEKSSIDNSDKALLEPKCPLQSACALHYHGQGRALEVFF